MEVFPQLDLKTHVGKLLVSTVFLAMGADNWVFETIIMDTDGDDLYIRRSHTVSSAKLEHMMAEEKAKQLICSIPENYN